MLADSDTPSTVHPGFVFFSGLCMGAADVVPGVSGGTMAFVLGIYPQLLAAIESVNLEFVRQLLQLHIGKALRQIPWKFIIPLGLGIATAVACLAELLTYLLREQPVYLFSFFFGLIVASILSLAARHTWNGLNLIAGLIGSVIGYLIVGLLPIDPGHSPIVLLLSGVVAICAMILPGISGSFILLILGQYQYCVEQLSGFLSSVRNLDWQAAVGTFLETVLPLALGAACGLMAFSRVLRFLMSRFYGPTIAVLIGFMAGSLRRIWPFKAYSIAAGDAHGGGDLEWSNVLPAEWSTEVLLAALFCLLGFVVLSVIDHLADRNNPVLKWLGFGSPKSEKRR